MHILVLKRTVSLKRITRNIIRLYIYYYCYTQEIILLLFYFFLGDLGFAAAFDFAAAFFALGAFGLVAFVFFTFERAFLGLAAAGFTALAGDFLAAIA
jgi:hypothetical protein